MKTKNKQAKSTPDIYQGLDLTKNLKACLIEDVHFLFYIFDNRQACHILKNAIAKTYEGLDSFMDIGKQTMLAYHENIFKCTPDKSLSPVLIAQYTWAKLCTIAIDRRTVDVPRLSSGRKSTIGSCEYRLGANTNPDVLKTPQAKTCYKLLKELIEETKFEAPSPTGEIATLDHVTEADLRQYIIDHAAELHTKQDPWRIFQYYRPTLITEKLITRK